MIAHYFTLALRNLWKYRTQSIISIVGLAVGFVCFALANLWIHYEMTYDARLEGIDRTYMLYRIEPLHATPKPFAQGSPLEAPMLRNDYPEVEAACGYQIYESTLRTESGREIKTPWLIADSTFFSIVPDAGMLLQGSMDFLRLTEQAALTEETAIRLFGSANDALGQKLTVEGRDTYTVGAILQNSDPHSNLYFGGWRMLKNRKSEWKEYMVTTLVRLRPDADPEAFMQKIREYSVRAETTMYSAVDGKFVTEIQDMKPFEHVHLMPLARYHYSELNPKLSIRALYLYLYLFSLTGGLVIVCALFNYLSLFVVRMRTRMREVELRRVCGSSVAGLFRLFGAEYLLALLISGLLGMALIEWVLPEFRKLSGVEGGIYVETLLYFAGVLLLSLLCLAPFVLHRHRQAFKGGRRWANDSKWSLWLQLFICFLILFCVGVMQKQLHHLSAGDLGWERHNTAVIRIVSDTPGAADAFDKQLDEMPFVSESIKDISPLFPPQLIMSHPIDKWDGKLQGDTKTVSFNSIYGFGYIPFYRLTLLEGNVPDADDKDKILVNETAVRAMGMTDPVGKKMGDRYTISGVLKDFYALPPTVPVEPTMFVTPEVLFVNYDHVVVVKYDEGAWDELRQRVDSACASFTPYPGWPLPYQLQNVEEEYDKLLASEYMLLRLLGIAALTCVLIAAFGIFSLVSLSCQQRRKEIAIRKVNGARIGNILDLFAREYLLMLVLAAVVAFPIGYVLMKHWLESYIKQTPISWWIYAVIFAGITAVVALCIGWRVWQAARSNPAKTIKAE
jgi:hypothetical protein